MKAWTNGKRSCLVPWCAIDATALSREVINGFCRCMITNPYACPAKPKKRNAKIMSPVLSLLIPIPFSLGLSEINYALI